MTVNLVKHPTIPGARYFGRSKLIMHAPQTVQDHNKLKSVFSIRNPWLTDAPAPDEDAVFAPITGQPDLGVYSLACGRAYDYFYGSGGLATRINSLITSCGKTPGNGDTAEWRFKQVAAGAVSPKDAYRRAEFEGNPRIASATHTYVVATTADSASSVFGAMENNNATNLRQGGGASRIVSSFMGALVFTRMLPVGKVDDLVDAWVANHELKDKDGGLDKLTLAANAVKGAFGGGIMLTNLSLAIFPDGTQLLVTGDIGTCGIYGDNDRIFATGTFAAPCFNGDGDWFPSSFLFGTGSYVQVYNGNAISTIRNATWSRGLAPSGAPIPGAPVGNNRLTTARDYIANLGMFPNAPRTIDGVPLEAIFGPAFREVGNGAMTMSQLVGMRIDAMTFNTGKDVVQPGPGLPAYTSDAAFLTAQGALIDDWAHQGHLSTERMLTPVMIAFLLAYALSRTKDGVPTAADIITQFEYRADPSATALLKRVQAYKPEK